MAKHSVLLESYGPREHGAVCSCGWQSLRFPDLGSAAHTGGAHKAALDDSDNVDLRVPHEALDANPTASPNQD